MSQSSRRIVLITLFLICSYWITLKESVKLTPTIRESRYRAKYTTPLQPTHVGPLNSYRLKEKHQISKPYLLDWLGFDKKINTYHFTFYNWYHFELSFVDLTYDSYIEFRSFSEEQFHDSWTHRVGFKLQDSFYPQGGRIKQPKNPNSNCSCCKCPKEKGLNLDIKTNVFNLTVRQYTVKNQSDSHHDGYRYSRFWYYTPNRPVDDAENDYYKSDLTITTFNFSYNGETRVIQANLTHVLRHDQCFSFVDQENQGSFRHKCYGGYAGGRMFIDKKIEHKQLVSYGKWMKSAYNLDFNRTRSFFQGTRSTEKLYNSIVPVSNWHWKEFKAYMQCFSKPEYYSKGQNLQKERYLGLHFARTLETSPVENMQDYIFFNGKIHPIHNVDYKFTEKYERNRNISFKGVQVKNVYQPNFQVNFTILSIEKIEQNNLFSERNEVRAYGYWSGWFDQGQRAYKVGVLADKVEFFNISGYIQTSNSIY